MKTSLLFVAAIAMAAAVVPQHWNEILGLISQSQEMTIPAALIINRIATATADGGRETTKIRLSLCQLCQMPPYTLLLRYPIRANLIR